MEIAIVGLNATLDREPVAEKCVMALPIGMGKSERAPNMTTFPVTARSMAEMASMVSLVSEAQRTNYWSNGPYIRDSKREKAREKKRWAKIRRKQGR
jgi:hypothetical protein